MKALLKIIIGFGVLSLGVFGVGTGLFVIGSIIIPLTGCDPSTVNTIALGVFGLVLIGIGILFLLLSYSIGEAILDKK